MCKAIVLYSGGKDSHYSLLLSLYHGLVPEALVVVEPGKEDSWLFHSVNVRWARLHGEIMGLPVYMIPVSGLKDLEYIEFKTGLKEVLRKHPDVDYIVVGAVRSRFQLERFRALADELGISLYTPIWGRDEVSLLKEEINELGFIVTAVQAYCLDLVVLGNPNSSEVLQSLLKAYSKCGVSPVGEGGEFETFVIRSPLFKGRGVTIHKARKILYPLMNVGYYIIEDASIL